MPCRKSKVIWEIGDKGVAVGGGVFFLVCFASDLTYRWRSFRERGRWRFVHPLTGGMFFFIPIWIVFGLAPLLAMPVMLIIFPPKKDPPRRVAAVADVRPLVPRTLCGTADSAIRA
ncbi:MAG: hypothetical protein FJ304_11035 [Planctomycetes bacterium]|nr:hypothetical protein [Planctomycetota bacterium]